MTDYLTLAGTALNKQPRQLFGIASRTIKSSLLPRLPIDIDARYEARIPENFTPCTEPIRMNTFRLQDSTTATRDEYSREAKAATNGEITFLNKTISFRDGSAVSVDAPDVLDQSLHWQLKCWGFEHIKPIWLSTTDSSEVTDSDLAIHKVWLDDWVDNHPIAAETGYLRRYWMPHSVCFRILNWSRYDSLFEDRLDDEFRRNIRRVVYKNAAFLSNNIEHGVGGNHLIENAIALIVAGVYANEPFWRNQGHRILERAAENQFFEDGGHIERSPMYHLIVLQRFVTAIDLLEMNGDRSSKLWLATKKASRFVEIIQPPDSRIPLFNDSVFNEALPLQSCLLYSRSIGINSNYYDYYDTRSLPNSGYYWLGEGNTQMLVAAHPVTVPHLPGHAHIHPGHFSLWIDGSRLITDTGVFQYKSGTNRTKTRSIKSHNTVQVDEVEPVRLDSSFWLWGNIQPNVVFNNNTIKLFYSVNRFRLPSYTHTRYIKLVDKSWIVTDLIQGDGLRRVSRLHIHPDWEVNEINKNRLEVINSNGSPILKIESSKDIDLKIKTSPYFPEFGKKYSRPVIEASKDKPGVIELRLKVLCDD